MSAILSPRHRIWSLPILLGGAWFGVRLGVGGDSIEMGRIALESCAGLGLGLLGSLGMNFAQDTRAQQQAAISENQQRIRKLELSSAKIEELRAELMVLRTTLNTYIDDKRRETDSIRGAIVDLNNDVSRLKDMDPSSELRPQLEMIAAKFGELAGMRQVVRTLSSKVRTVEHLAAQVCEVESRMTASNHDGTIPDGWVNWYEKVQREIAEVHDVIGQKVQEQVKGEVTRLLERWREEDSLSDDELVSVSVTDYSSARSSGRMTKVSARVSESASRTSERIERYSKRLKGIESQVESLSEVVAALDSRIGQALPAIDRLNRQPESEEASSEAAIESEAEALREVLAEAESNDEQPAAQDALSGRSKVVSLRLVAAGSSSRREPVVVKADPYKVTLQQLALYNSEIRQRLLSNHSQSLRKSA